MAKAAKEKTKTKSEKKKSVKEEETFPLSAVQDLKVTKRNDPNAGPDISASDNAKKRAPGKTQYSIEKIKIENDHHLNIGYGMIKPDGKHEHHPGVSFDHFMHADLSGKFIKLQIHLALLTDYIPIKSIKDIKNYNASLVEKFRVTGVSIKANEGLTITGYRKTHRKKTVTLNTPFTLTEENEKTAYRFLEDMNECVAELLSEAEQYLLGSKVGEDPQGSLTFPEQGEDESFAEEDL